MEEIESKLGDLDLRSDQKSRDIKQFIPSLRLRSEVLLLPPRDVVSALPIVLCQRNAFPRTRDVDSNMGIYSCGGPLTSW